MNDDRGMAIVAEYMVLLGVSLLIFIAIFVGINSFNNTTLADARAEAAYDLALLVSERISDAVESQASAVEDVDIPRRICGQSYLVYLSEDGKSVCVLIGRESYRTPVVVPDGIRAGGFMSSAPGLHRIEYEAASKTITLT